MAMATKRRRTAIELLSVNRIFGKTVKIYNIALWIVAVILAIGVALSSYVVAYEVRSPERACAIQVPPSSGACANLAAATYAARRQKNAKAFVLKLERAMALQGYRAEPLSANALSTLIAPFREKMSGKDRQALLELAGKVTRRNSLINAELIESAGYRDDKQAFFQWLSRSMLTNNEARKSYVGVIAQATSMPGAVEALTPVIGAAPKWAPDYWRAVVLHPQSLGNAAKLRLALVKRPWRQTTIDAMDERLVLGLVQYGQLDEAFALADSLAPLTWRARGQTNRLINGRFADQPHFPPLDWELAAMGNLGATIEPARKRLLISAIGGAQGMAARQLVRLSPGDYTLNWVLSSNADNSLRFRIFCAEADGASLPPVIVPAAAGKKQAPVRIAGDGCNWRWVSLDIFLPDDAAGIDVYLSDLSLAPTGSATAQATR
ncbi:hypothetical protein [Sphingopyxis witflariensis]|uniref:hypothetical protein n=1 Tax=Sphingopyxis witflariensis TaxID=173675 RepID=UPI00138FDA00|nr:hypothetical protein [Sphingopyxis witflariensis]